MSPIRVKSSNLVVERFRSLRDISVRGCLRLTAGACVCFHDAAACGGVCVAVLRRM
eukprot:COSAG06_NODE_6850_length_2746_cov_75.454099_3_plen_56_part_00